VKLPAGEVVIRADGIVLREWTAADVPAMVTLFDEESIDLWTPLESPFDLASQAVARAAGFHQTDDPISVRERKGYRLEMATWRSML
jgi:hypothetical protein